jgi:hypothetical protein
MNQLDLSYNLKIFCRYFCGIQRLNRSLQRIVCHDLVIEFLKLHRVDPSLLLAKLLNVVIAGIFIMRRETGGALYRGLASC